MASYVMVQDLIRNGGENCSIFHLNKPPYEDHLVIVEDHNNVSHLGSVKISYGDKILIWRIKKEDIVEPERWLSVGDLNDARGILFRDRMCFKCLNFDYYRCCLFNGSDNWDNYKTGSCPNKKEKIRLKWGDYLPMSNLHGQY